MTYIECACILYIQIVLHIFKLTTKTTTNSFSNHAATDRSHYFAAIYILKSRHAGDTHLTYVLVLVRAWRTARPGL